MKLTDPIRKFLFFGLGLTRGGPAQEQKRHRLLIVEPDGARASRRNIIALAGILVFAGLAGANPSDLSVFGVKPDEGVRGVIVIAAAAVAMQFYWYYLRYFHITEDGTAELPSDQPPISIKETSGIEFEHKTANFISNWVAFLLTVVSWIIIASWIVDASGG
ncbi:MAG: hypothetical protein F4160_07715 [Rhodospirillaceae bacterium]|nr:hypothetical protein [Rhodospirillaceae bacterium]MYH36673.1 hypothetical protein [Rhodospirillaceae bacterium]MYK16304.1 hypothetical protein [Rhodospirillaceae bacterium]